MCRHKVADWDAALANPGLQGQGRRQSRRPAAGVYGTLASRLGGHQAHQVGAV
jgi:hypothetical protein